MTKTLLWKEAPFVRLIMPLMMGILLQYHLSFHLLHLLFSLFCFLLALLFSRLLPVAVHFKIAPLRGVIITLMILVFGCLITFNKNIRNDKQWYGRYLQPGNKLIVRIDEPLLEKAATYKATGMVESIINGNSIVKVRGKIFVYFKKDERSALLKYGDVVIINKPLQEIKNPGNPGEFDYKSYAGFQQIFYTVFVNKNDRVLASIKEVNPVKHFIYSCRNSILNILNQSMHGHEDEASVAEALMIGYTADLDKQIVQAYSNTGVIHIIAISGMHLGLIYILLIRILNSIPILKNLKIIRMIIIISILWLFAFLTGGNASILRSALMFTCIIIGTQAGKKSSIYNSLAASAFMLLWYNPFYLWDVGFELSYLAILGIVIFHKYVFKLIYLENKLIIKFWEMLSLTLCAQILTFPICLYYFHQFPNIFLASNLIMIPLSSIILLAEIALVFCSKIIWLGNWLAKLTVMLLQFMNNSVSWFSQLPFALSKDIQATLFSTILLYLFILGVSFWLIKKNKRAFYFTFFILLFISFDMGYRTWESNQQHKVIVYNVAHHCAIDFINGNRFAYLGDSVVIKDYSLYNYNLKPSRILYSAKHEYAVDSLLAANHPLYLFSGKSIVIINNENPFVSITGKVKSDVILITGNPTINISDLYHVFDCNQYVFDSSNPLWKIDQWKKECEELHLRFHCTSENGAYIMNF